jgi:hypothetical protein
MGGFKVRFLARFSAGYMRLIHATCKVERLGNPELLDGEDQYVVGFWHGDCYCYYPLLQNRGVTVATTVNARGSVIDAIADLFGYKIVRLPDDPDLASSLPELRKMLAGMKVAHGAFTMDGPLGPYHVPKRFFLMTAYLAKKPVIPVSLKARRVIRLTRRWDKYVIPLPFISHLAFTYHPPLEVHRDKMDDAAKKIIDIMG